MKANDTNTQLQKGSRESGLFFCPTPLYMSVCTRSHEHSPYAEIKHAQNNEDFVIFNTVLLYITLQLKYKFKPESLTRIKTYTYL